MTETNVFGERICDKDCPLLQVDPGYGCYCEANLGYTGRITPKDGKAQYGMLCRLPIEFKIVRNEA